MDTGCDTKRLRIFVSGRVQGVFFRASTAERARALGVHGWVRNLPDGRVEIVAEGRADAVTALAGWARKGPPGARVDALQAEEETPCAEHGFLVR